MEVDGETYKLDDYDSIRFKGDRPHKYVNPSSDLAILLKAGQSNTFAFSAVNLTGGRFRSGIFL